MPKVSIIMPNHNKEEFIEEAIQSVLSQNYEDWELIVVDDSTDSSRSKIERFKDPRIKKIYLNERSGPSKARNIGLREARGELIAFLDSDDVYATEKLSLQLGRYLEYGDPQAVIYSDWFSIRKGRVETLSHFARGAPMAEGKILDYLLASRSIVNSALMVPKRDFEMVGYFREDLKVAEDLEMLYRLAYRFPFAIVKKATYGYRIGIESISTLNNMLSHRTHVQILESYIRICHFRNEELKRRAYRRLMAYMAAAHQYRKMVTKMLTNKYCFMASLAYLREGSWFRYN
ncbi:MAG: glycosyltransferase family A protein [Conexivisphaerales archaeon]